MFCSVLVFHQNVDHFFLSAFALWNSALKISLGAFHKPGLFLKGQQKLDRIAYLMTFLDGLSKNFHNWISLFVKADNIFGYGKQGDLEKFWER
jgi:hypothetical protein